MGYQSDFSLLDLEELHAPTQTVTGVVAQRYCLANTAQYRLENEILSKAWTITDAMGEVVFRVRGKKVDWVKSKRELVDEHGNSIVYMEEKPWRLKNVWRAFAPGDSEPLYTLKATTAFSFKPGINIFLRSNTAQKKPDYTIEGLFLAKKCSIYFGEELVAEVTRDVSLKNLIVNKSIFNVTIYPGVDIAFIFSLVIIMDKIYVHDD
ncbi:protein LURP-one-related 15 [Physcomitrium patens]|uniref:Uncharacterized protein n=1 Tax=Physcomitrium patens TaxID=3218 RepID=A9S6M4_PHYPA|nr:protein LURP-one-related 15-like [Physcomitrium patens]XP_024393151.1 protein LURP-one-related 15-like [Physcomitrium patens]XP_024393153.1 protein LURP-one-related 15-like [Physcomitrium patens]XP_024393154.1 protein LURP-one-related 15-like [Physcomitrium patens]XP_024393155.1 protein LURP-one-related 15-like [Physcomitrium patens]PNR42313.1 hypothetical protein PHYPA_017142 [Physcomitrium patens]|eukprot:XP_024393150.1 protein LURP-one-related 15-like [Physcomitrella patens]